MPKLVLLISRRYLLAKKSHNAINLITAISVLVVSIGTLALILILSVFNGLESLITSLYNTVEPDLLLSPASGKYLDESTLPLKKIAATPGVADYCKVLSDMALVKYSSSDDAGERQVIALVKGVENKYHQLNGIDSMMSSGNFLVEKSGLHFAVAGNGLSRRLGLNLSRYDRPLFFYYPRADASPNNPLDAFNIEQALPAGVFSIQQELDDGLIYVSLDFARKLMSTPHQISTLEIKLKPSATPGEVKEKLMTYGSGKWTIKTRKEQNSSIYKITQSEKWMGMLILSFILLIAIFNVVGSITVLIIEKKEDIITLSSMGASTALIKRIFLSEGMMISFFGGLIGLALGFILILLQQHYNLIPMDGGFAVNAFPVKMLLSDFVLVFVTVMGIGFLATLLPVNRIAESILHRKFKST